jgi:hypothetical protein
MGLASVCLSIAVLQMVAPAAGSTQPTVAAPVDDGSDGPKLRVPELSFWRPSTLWILGKGRWGTWSLVGSMLGNMQGCSATIMARCLDVASADVGIAWRPFGSLVSLFSTIGVGLVPGSSAPTGFQAMGGLRVDLPSRTQWRRLGFGGAR